MEKNQLQIDPTVKYIMEHRYTKYIVIAIIATSVLSVVALLYMLFFYDVGSVDYSILPKLK